MKNEMKVLIEVCGIFSRNPTVSNCGAVEQALLNVAALNKCHKADGSPAASHSQAVHPHIAAFGPSDSDMEAVYGPYWREFGMTVPTVP